MLNGWWGIQKHPSDILLYTFHVTSIPGICAFHWFIKRNWKTSELRTFETMTTRVTVAAVVVVGVGGNRAISAFCLHGEILRSSIRVRSNDGYDESIVPPHYVAWMLHSGSLSNLQLGSRCGHLRIYVLRHIFSVLHRFGSVVPETIFSPARSLCFVLIYVNFLCAITHHITDTSPSHTTLHIAPVPKDHTFDATEIRRKTCERRQSPGWTEDYVKK